MHPSHFRGATAPIYASQDAGLPGSSGGQVCDLLIGTYKAGGKSEGIYVYRFDSGNGELSRIASAQTMNPSYLVVSGDRNYVYAVNELPGDNGLASQRGGVSAFRFDRASGRPVELPQPRVVRW